MMKKKVFYIILFFVSILSCNSLTDNNNEGFTATLIMVSDNYPNGYKTHMGKLSYSRCITLLFSVKNTTVVQKSEYIMVRDSSIPTVHTIKKEMM